MLHPKALRTHILWLLGPKTRLKKGFWAILSLRVRVSELGKGLDVALSGRDLEGDGMITIGA